MSKNFEVLLRVEKQADVFQVEERQEPPPLPVALPARTLRKPPIHIDAAVHDAEIKLVQRVFLLPGEAAPAAVVFCGAEPFSGTTGICARAGENLALLTGLPVCLVDGNLRSPSLHRYFGLETLAGLSTSVDRGPVRNLIQPIKESLALLRAGPDADGARSAWLPERMRLRLAELRREFSYVLIDAPAVNERVDAMFFGQMADGALLVVNSQKTHRDTARKAKENLAAAQVRLLGAVMNNRTFPIPNFLYKRL